MKNKSVDQSHQNTRVNVDHAKIEYQKLNSILLTARRFLFIRSWIIKVRIDIKKNTPNADI